MSTRKGIMAQRPAKIEDFNVCASCASGPAPGGKGCMPGSCRCNRILFYHVAMCRACSESKSLCQVCGKSVNTVSLLAYIEAQAANEGMDVDTWLDTYADTVTEGNHRSRSAEYRLIKLAKTTPLVDKEVALIRAGMSEYGEKIQNIAIGEFVREVRKLQKNSKSK